MTDLLAFVKERLDEAEEAIKVVRRPYRLYIYDDGTISEPEEYEFPDDRAGEYKQDTDGDDILRNRHQGYALLYDPDQALRDIAAKRSIIERHPVGDLDYCTNCWAHAQVLSVEAPCPTLRHLAAPYSDHQDFRDEWAAQPIS